MRPDLSASPRISLPFSKGGRRNNTRQVLLSALLWIKEVGLFAKGLRDVWIPRPLPLQEDKEERNVPPATIFQVLVFVASKAV